MTTKVSLEQQLLALAGAKAGSEFFFPDAVRLPCKCIVEPHLRRHRLQPDGCKRCQDRRWVPNPDPFAWRRAFRGLNAGILIEVVPGCAGDSVEVWFGNTQAAVLISEGLRDWEAEVTAYYRAVKQIPNVEMGETP